MRLSPLRSLAAPAIMALVFSACHGGTTNLIPASAGAGSDATQFAAMTQPDAHQDTGPAAGYGKVVNYATGEPIADVRVAVFPWDACEKVSEFRVSCPAALYSTTTRANGDFAVHLKAGGHYLLVIGDDSGKNQTRTTVHDSIELAAGSHALIAPKACADPWEFGKGVPRCILRQPLIPIPASEASGSYRLSGINLAKEMPCVTAINKLRVQHGYQPMVVDEWLTENERQFAAYYTNPLHGKYPGKGTPLLTYPNLWGWGGSDCPAVDTWNAEQLRAYVFNAQTQWFGARYDPYVPHSKISAFDIMVFREDPRHFRDPAVPNWP